MNITVEDHHPADEPAGLHLAGGNGRVIKHTVALTPVGAGVVGAPGQTRGYAVGEGRGRRIDRRPGAPQRPLHEGHAPGKPDPADLGGRKRAGEHPPHVGPLVHPQEFVVGGGVGLDEFKRRPGRRMGLEPPPQRRILGHGKAVPRGQGQRIAIGGKEPHASRAYRASQGTVPFQAARVARRRARTATPPAAATATSSHMAGSGTTTNCDTNPVSLPLPKVAVSATVDQSNVNGAT